QGVDRGGRCCEALPLSAAVTVNHSLRFAALLAEAQRGRPGPTAPGVTDQGEAICATTRRYKAGSAGLAAGSPCPPYAPSPPPSAIPVPASQVLPGALYFVGTPATHVGLVVGAGLVLDASASHGDVVLRQLWTSTGITFGRVPRPGAVAVTPAPTTAPATP